jgi:(p)ppGpp synthase/HD superfamily hydrolase
MIAYNYVSQVIALYQGHFRRNREPYVLHVLRMADNAKKCGLGNEIQLLCLLHDVLELNPQLTITHLQAMFNLQDIDVEVLKTLTRATDESSEQHFQRVLNSRSIFVLIVKYFDCLDNAEFVAEDAQFYKEYMKESHKEAKKKYVDRLRMIAEQLQKYGHPVPFA